MALLRCLLLLAITAPLAALGQVCCDSPTKPPGSPVVCDGQSAEDCKKLQVSGVCMLADECPTCAVVTVPVPRGLTCEDSATGKAVDTLTRCQGTCREAGTKCEINTSVGSVTCKSSTGVTNFPIITECHCKGQPQEPKCARQEKVELFEVDVGSCAGSCEGINSQSTCLAGLDDQYAASSPDSAPVPSAAWSTTYPQCRQSIGFDVSTTHNRFICHSFDSCFENKCPVVRAAFDFCARPAAFSDAFNDGIVLGVLGTPVWSSSFSALLGSPWTAISGASLCMTLDLSSLPGGANILAAVAAASSLDVLVQDDTVVDFFRLRLRFDDCLQCAPASIAINTLSTSAGVQSIPSIEKCDCFEKGGCQRHDLFHTYFPWAGADAVSVNVGRCGGECPITRREWCVPRYRTQVIQAPGSGERQKIQVISRCDCARPTATPLVDDSKQ